MSSRVGINFASRRSDFKTEGFEGVKRRSTPTPGTFRVVLTSRQVTASLETLVSRVSSVGLAERTRGYNNFMFAW